MRWNRVVLIGAALCVSSAVAQLDSLPRRYQNIVETNNIANQGSKPWHLKASFQRFDLKGKTVEDGTFDEWWSGTQSWRLSIQSAGKTSDFVHNGDKTYSNTADATIPIAVQMVLPQLIEPASLDMFLNSDPTLGKREIDSLNLDCVTLTRSNTLAAYAHRHMPYKTQICLNEKGVVRVEFADELIEFVHNKLGSFHGQSIATSLQASDRNGKLLDAEILALNSIPEADVNLSTTGLVQDEVICPLVIDGTFPKTKILSKVRPDYPDSARASRLGGIVLLRAIVDKNGDVKSAEVISTPSKDLAKASLEAVRQWKYEAPVINGESVGVDTNIEVRFNLNQ